MASRARHVLPIALAALVLAAGCEDKPRHAAKKRIKPREVIGKSTQDIRRADTEVQKGGAQQANMKITAKDPITVYGNGYRVAVGKLSMSYIDQAVEIYRAQNDGNYPKNHDEFMEQVIKANNIRLPTLPYYQEYAYDEKEHKLMVIEYPARKAQFQEQSDRDLGRK